MTPQWIEPALNIFAFTVGCVGFTLAMFWQHRKKDQVERAAMSFFVFMQAAMWGAEVFYIFTVVMRLSGHRLVE